MTFQLPKTLLMSVLALLVACTMTTMLAACGGGETTEETVVKPKIELTVNSLDQTTRLGTKVAEGQYVILGFHLKNVSTEAVTINPAELLIKYNAKEEKDQYTQGDENATLYYPFAAQYGEDKAKKLMSAAVNINPRIELDRYTVFMLPAEANVDEYVIVFKPSSGDPETTYPLVSESTQVNDQRSSSSAPPTR